MAIVYGTPQSCMARLHLCLVMGEGKGSGYQIQHFCTIKYTVMIGDDGVKRRC